MPKCFLKIICKKIQVLSIDRFLDARDLLEKKTNFLVQTMVACGNFKQKIVFWQPLTAEEFQTSVAHRV